MNVYSLQFLKDLNPNHEKIEKNDFYRMEKNIAYSLAAKKNDGLKRNKFNGLLDKYDVRGFLLTNSDSPKFNFVLNSR